MNMHCKPPAFKVTPPSHSERDHVSFFHPGYEPPVLLFRLSKLDMTTEGARGVHLGTALRACEIIANNTHGFLSTSPDRADVHAFVQDQQDFELCLVRSHYFYHAVHADFALRRYPVCASFSAWRPPSALPREWAHAQRERSREAHENPEPYNSLFSLNIDSKTPDHECCISGWQSALRTVQLIPETEEHWFNAVGLGDSSPPPASSNLITLRSDIRAILEEHIFTLAPRGREGDLVATFLQAGAPEAAHLYHNRVVKLPARVSMAYLYCRFAWTVIGLVQRYCKHGPPDFEFVDVLPELRPTSLGRVQPNGGDHTLSDSDEEDGEGNGSVERMLLPHTLDELDFSDNEFIMPSPSSHHLFFTDAADMERRLAELESRDARVTALYESSQSDDFTDLYFERDDDDVYPGFSRYRRMAYEYIQRTPSVRACGESEHAPVSDDSEDYSISTWLEDEFDI
ncbi:hypothetical protein EXIGLDRAFT_758546 [Exidia glandulosa HHB12029]|uniref:HNH nuclease domain-containing protein n=1 Tax=Exidia glandulosa HHB12029 TaxID=1314781 RepID=A0A165QYS9_EXIGL|nr:hypothetical protein EXIGLDRAFT_758546 [Exidia glandulosa HHB12029]